LGKPVEVVSGGVMRLEKREELLAKRRVTRAGVREEALALLPRKVQGTHEQGAQACIR
jgi:hypothetical protein